MSSLEPSPEVQSEGTDESNEAGHLFEFSGVNLWGCLFIAAVVWAIVWGALAIWAPVLGQDVNLALASMAAAVFGFWLRATSTRIREDRADPDSLEANRFEWPSPHYLRLISQRLTIIDGPEGRIEEEIDTCTRDHKIFLVARIGLPGFLALVFLAVAALSLAGDTAFPWWLALALAAMCLPVCLVLALPWRYKSWAVTSFCLMYNRIPPVWLPLLQPDNNRDSYGLIEKVDPVRSFWGMLIGRLLGPFKGWGTVVIHFPDRDPLVIPRVPNYLRFADKIEQRRVAFTQLRLGDQEHKLLSAVQKLSDTVGELRDELRTQRGEHQAL